MDSWEAFRILGVGLGSLGKLRKGCGKGFWEGFWWAWGVGREGLGEPSG